MPHDSNFLLPTGNELDGADIDRAVFLTSGVEPFSIEFERHVDSSQTSMPLGLVSNEIKKRRLMGEMPTFEIILFYVIGNEANNENPPDLVWLYDIEAVTRNRGACAGATAAYRMADTWEL